VSKSREKARKREGERERQREREREREGQRKTKRELTFSRVHFLPNNEQNVKGFLRKRFISLNSFNKKGGDVIKNLKYEDESSQRFLSTTLSCNIIY
jgi:hypothetical protein